MRCHSDKETNKPRAAEFFHKLPGALEILTGSSARDIFNMLNFLLYCLFKLLVTYFVCKKLNRVGQNFKHQARRKIEYQTILEKDWKDIWRQEKERERERANSTNDDTLIVEIFLLYFLLSLFFP